MFDLLSTLPSGRLGFSAGHGLIWRYQLTSRSPQHQRLLPGRFLSENDVFLHPFFSVRSSHA